MLGIVKEGKTQYIDRCGAHVAMLVVLGLVEAAIDGLCLAVQSCVVQHVSIVCWQEIIRL